VVRDLIMAVAARRSCDDWWRLWWEELCCFIEKVAMAKKVYAHYEGKYASEELTKILRIQPETQVEDLLRSFVKDAGFRANPKLFAILLSSGEVVESGTIYHKLQNKEDCLIQDLIVPGSHISQSSPQPQPADQPTLTEIETLIQNKQFRKARLRCEELLKSSPSNFAALEALTLVLFSSKLFQEAAIVGEKALQVEKKDSSRRTYFILGQSLLENQDPEEALYVFRKGVEVCEKRPTASAEAKTLYLNLRAESCRALFLLGRHPEAGSAINDLMTTANPYDADPQTNVASLLIYAEIAAQYDKVPSPLSVFASLAKDPRGPPSCPEGGGRRADQQEGEEASRGDPLAPHRSRRALPTGASLLRSVISLRLPSNGNQRPLRPRTRRTPLPEGVGH
jgi:tetratricopeptide (TPR) repeat protein